MGARRHRSLEAAACADASRLRLRRCSASSARFCSLVSSPIPDLASGASFRREIAQGAVHFLLTQLVDALEQIRGVRPAQQWARLGAGFLPLPTLTLGLSFGASAVSIRSATCNSQRTDAALALHEFRKRDVHAELGIDAVTHLDGDERIEAEIAQRLLDIDARG